MSNAPLAAEELRYQDQHEQGCQSGKGFTHAKLLEVGGNHEVLVLLPAAVHANVDALYDAWSGALKTCLTARPRRQAAGVRFGC